MGRAAAAGVEEEVAVVQSYASSTLRTALLCCMDGVLLALVFDYCV